MRLRVSSRQKEARMISRIKHRSTAGGALVAAALALWARPALAVNCDTLPGPIYVAGSSAVKPFIVGMDKALYSAGVTTIVYQSQGSCVGVNDIIADTLITGTANYFDDTGAQLNCDLPAAGQ